MEFLSALSAHAFLRYALAAGLLAAIGCGLIGPFVVVRRISSLTGAIAHAVLGGMGIALYFGGSPLAGAVVAAVAAMTASRTSIPCSCGASTIRMLPNR